MPAAEGGEHFPAGRVNQYPVLVALEGEKPFRYAPPEEWSRGSGLTVENIRFQIDKSSAIKIHHAQDAPHGSLILSTLGAMIVAYDQNGAKAVLLESGTGSTAIDDAAPVAFTAWRIVASGEPPVVMYRPPTLK